MGSTKPEALQSQTKTVTTTSNNNNNGTNAKPYGKIVLTLRNQLLPEDKLETTPSQADGLDADTEMDLRIYGCELIQTAGILLKLPQVAMATGQVLLQRFYYSKSLVHHLVEHTAMACVCLASKIEEAPRRVRDVINVFTHIRQVESNKPITPVILDQNYIQLKNQVIKTERRVLKELGFCVHIKHPHKIIVMYLQVLCLEKNSNLMQYSWNYMNDSLRTDVFVRYQPETVACACIYLTARKLKLPLPRSPAPWYALFGVAERDIRDVCVRILKLYTRPKPNADVLGKKVQDLCRKFQEAKIRARGGTNNSQGGGGGGGGAHDGSGGTPNNNNNNISPGGEQQQQQLRTTGAHNAWGGFISRSGSHVAPPLATGSSTGGGGTGTTGYENNGKRTSRSRSRSRSSGSPSREGGADGGSRGGGGGGGGSRHHKRSSKKHGRSRSRTPPPVSSSSSSRKKSGGHKRSRYSYSRSRSPPSPKSRKNRDKRKSRSPSYERESRNDRYADRYDKYGGGGGKDDDKRGDRYDGGSSKKSSYESSSSKRYSSSSGRSRSGKHRQTQDD